MSFRIRIAAWVVVSCILLIGVMMFTAHSELEEELRAGRVDRHHQQVPGWVLHNSLPEEEIQDILGELLKSWLWTAAMLIPLSLAGGLLLARRALRPVHDINRQLTQMKPDSLHGGITIPETDPVIEGLATHLNGLLDKAGIAYREMAEFSERVAHELRTPLMLLRMRLEHAPPGMPPEFHEELQDEIGRLSRHVERSLVAAKAERGTLEPVPHVFSVSRLLAELCDDYRMLADERGLPMEVKLSDGLWMHSDEDLFRQALHGVLENAVRYAATRLMVSCGECEGMGFIEVRNDDNPATRATGGLGLGLRLVRGICKVGGIALETTAAQGGFVVTMRFHTQPSAADHSS
jgi:signal transduction histidine kinase